MKWFATLAFLVLTVTVRAQMAETEMANGVAAFNAKQYDEAMQWFEKAAVLGNLDAFYNIGLLYDNGLGVGKSLDLAVEWYKKAADLGQKKAMLQLADIYSSGEGAIPQDFKKSFYWNKKLALLGNAQSMYNVGVMYLNETGADAATAVESIDNAVIWFSKCNEAEPTKCDEGLRYAGMGYFTEGLYAYQRKDFGAAFQLYSKGAALNCPEAMTNLGAMYCSGESIAKDIKSARHWFEKAAGLGNSVAKANLQKLDEKPADLTIQIRQPNGKFKTETWTDSTSGYAIYTFTDGNIYEGEIKNGIVTGKGKYLFKTGERYEGSFVDGIFDGNGKMFNDDGTLRYEGGFKKDNREGFGTYYYSHGEKEYKYTGQWLNNRENGQGKYISASGVYEGGWENGYQQGKGRQTWNDGTVYEGNYEKGYLNGDGTITYADGTKSTGTFKDGNPTGKWLYTRADGTVEERFFKSPGLYVTYRETVSSTEKTRFNDDALYKEWWDKTYGGGESKMPDMNIQQASYQVGKQSEAQRHQNAMDQISRETTKQMERGFKY